STPIAAPVPVPAPDAQAASTPAVTAPTNAKTPDPTPAKVSGFLTLNSSPWSYIFIDGRKLPSTTPLQKHKLAPGTHQVRLESRGAGKNDEFTVTIRAGQTEKKIVDFSKK